MPGHGSHGSHGHSRSGGHHSIGHSSIGHSRIGGGGMRSGFSRGSTYSHRAGSYYRPYGGGRRVGGHSGGGRAIYLPPTVITPEQAAYRDACDAYDDLFIANGWTYSLSALARFLLFVVLPLTAASAGSAWFKVDTDGTGLIPIPVRIYVGVLDYSNCGRWSYVDWSFCYGMDTDSNANFFGKANSVTSAGQIYLSFAILCILNAVIILFRGCCVACTVSPSTPLGRFQSTAAAVDLLQAIAGSIALIAVTAKFSSSTIIAAIDKKALCTTDSCTSLESASDLATAACILYSAATLLFAIRCVLVFNARKIFSDNPNQPFEPIEGNVPPITPLQMSAIKVADFLIASSQLDFLISSSDAMMVGDATAVITQEETVQPDPRDLYKVAYNTNWAKPAPLRSDLPPGSVLVPMCVDNNGTRRRIFVTVDPAHTDALSSGGSSNSAVLQTLLAALVGGVGFSQSAIAAGLATKMQQESGNAPYPTAGGQVPGTEGAYGYGNSNGQQLAAPISYVNSTGLAAPIPGPGYGYASGGVGPGGVPAPFAVQMPGAEPGVYISAPVYNSAPPNSST